MRARLVVLEVLSMSTLRIVFALTGESDSGHKKAIATLNAIKAATRSRLHEIGDSSIAPDGERYLDELLSELSANLGLMRPKSKGI